MPDMSSQIGQISCFIVFQTQGKPKPVVSWTKDGQPLDKKRVNIRSTDRDSILFVRAAEREDSGVYEMCVKVEDFEDKASLTVQIVGEQNAGIRLKGGRMIAEDAVRNSVEEVYFGVISNSISTWLFAELPGPPASVKTMDTWGFNVALEWTPPSDNGNTDITGYTIQKADKKTGVSSQRWRVSDDM